MPQKAIVNPLLRCAQLPFGANCLSVHRVGESERGVLHYFMDQVPTRYERKQAATSAHQCRFVLAQGFQHDANVLNDIAYRRVLWSGARQGDTREQFWLLDLGDRAETRDRPLISQKGNSPPYPP